PSAIALAIVQWTLVCLKPRDLAESAARTLAARPLKPELFGFYMARCPDRLSGGDLASGAQCATSSKSWWVEATTRSSQSASSSVAKRTGEGTMRSMVEGADPDSIGLESAARA